MSNKYIISCVGMEADQCKEIEDELNDPKSEQTYFVIDKPCTISSTNEGWSDEGE